MTLADKVLTMKDTIEANYIGTTVHYMFVGGSRIHGTDKAWSDYDVFFVFSGDINLTKVERTVVHNSSYISFVGLPLSEMNMFLRCSFWGWENVRNSQQVIFDDGTWLKNEVFEEHWNIPEMIQDMYGYIYKLIKRRSPTVEWKRLMRAVTLILKVLWMKKHNSHAYPLLVNDLINDLESQIPKTAIINILSNASQGSVSVTETMYDWLDSQVADYL